jgi:hypothetical protein
VGDDLARWTFETTMPATAGPFAAESGAFAASSEASAFHASTSAYTSTVGNGSAHSFSSNNWQVGDYYQIKTSSIGYEQLTLLVDHVSSSSGPQNFDVFYSTDGTSFTDLMSFNSGARYLARENTNPFWSGTTNVSADTKIIVLNAVATLNNQANLYFRFVDQSTTSAGNGTVATSGTSRIDNVVLSGTLQSQLVDGDFSQNGTVDAADYVVWREHLGQTFGNSGYLLPNDGGVSTGVVDQADYNHWRSRFGATSGEGALNSAEVPEPTGAIVLLTPGALLFGRRGRSRILR